MIKKNYSTQTCWVRGDYNQPDIMRLAGYQSPHSQHTPKKIVTESLSHPRIQWNGNSLFNSLD